jgi:uncharacterized membrane protein YbhN (UPF0104 family)
MTTEARPRRRRPDGRLLVSFAISAASLVGVVWWASRQEAPPRPEDAQAVLLLVGAVAVYALATLIRGWRWHVILRLDGIEHRARDALGLVCVGYMGNTVLPARGGELLRVVLLRARSNGGRRQILGSILAERALDALVLVGLFCLLTIGGVGDAPLGNLPAVLAAVGVLAAVVALWVYLRLRRSGRLERFAEIVRPFVRASRPLLGPQGIAPLVATVVVWMLEGLIFFMVARSLDIVVDVFEGLFLNVFSSFVALIPAAPGYVGTFDAAILFGLRAFDISGADAVGFAVFIRLVLFLPITVVGLLLVLTRYGGFTGLRRSSEA